MFTATVLRILILEDTIVSLGVHHSGRTHTGLRPQPDLVRPHFILRAKIENVMSAAGEKIYVFVKYGTPPKIYVLYCAPQAENIDDVGCRDRAPQERKLGMLGA